MQISISPLLRIWYKCLRIQSREKEWLVAKGARTMCMPRLTSSPTKMAWGLIDDLLILFPQEQSRKAPGSSREMPHVQDLSCMKAAIYFNLISGCCIYHAFDIGLILFPAWYGASEKIGAHEHKVYMKTWLNHHSLNWNICNIAERVTIDFMYVTGCEFCFFELSLRVFFCKNKVEKKEKCL